MRRFYIEGLREGSVSVKVRGPEFKHLSRVLRLREGAVVALFNGSGLELIGRIGSIAAEYAEVLIDSATRQANESPLRTVLIAGLVKGEKPELIIQKATELGIKEITFYPADRSIPTPDSDKTAQRITRWQKISVEAAKQCGRTMLPRLRFAPDIKTAISGCDGLLKLMMWEREKTTRLGDALKNPMASNGAAFLVGPEGGFTDAEVESAKEAGYVCVSLGPRILRAETAAIVIMAIIQHVLGDMR